MCDADLRCVGFTFVRNLAQAHRDGVGGDDRGNPEATVSDKARKEEDEDPLGMSWFKMTVPALVLPPCVLRGGDLGGRWVNGSDLWDDYRPTETPPRKLTHRTTVQASKHQQYPQRVPQQQPQQQQQQQHPPAWRQRTSDCRQPWLRRIGGGFIVSQWDGLYVRLRVTNVHGA